MSLFAKLRFKPSVPVYLLGDAAGVGIMPQEEGYTVLKKLPVKSAEPVQQVVLFARDAAKLQEDFATLVSQLAADAVLWMAYPKKSGSIKSELTRDRGWQVVDAAGYVGVSQAALNEDWSALWFKKAGALKKHLRATPLHERKMEGIDYVARAVSLPADATQAIGVVPGLQEFFASLSFSHQREWAEAIAGAKKPETRARRIAKMVEDLSKQQEEKAAKKKKT